MAAVVHDNFLLFVDGPQGKLFQMALNGTTVLELPASSKPQNPVAVDFDPVTSTVYWTDIESRTIRRAALNGSNQEIFLQLQPGKFSWLRKKDVIEVCNRAMIRAYAEVLIGGSQLDARSKVAACLLWWWSLFSH